MLQDVHMKLNPGLPMAKAAFNKKETVFTQKTELKFKEETSKLLHLEHSLYGAETGTLWKVDQKYMEVLKCGAGEGGRRFFGLIV